MKKRHFRRTQRRVGALFAFVLTFFATTLAWAKETRLAIVVGNNGSATLGRAELRYADDDAAKYAALFASSSQPEDVELLARFDADTTRLFPAQAKKSAAPTRAGLDAAVSRLAARARDAQGRGDRVVFTFVFAGHGDVEDGRGFLELEDGRFFREDLESLLTRVPATRAHVLLDACNSVYMLVARKPGGTRFTTPEEIERSMAARLAHVGTFVSTSADAQVYEWSRIESGVFSHSIRSGISGAADLDGDGRVTYGELRAFVRIAASGVPNARFRPRIYARGPGGKDDEVVFEPRAMGEARKLALAPGAERRVTVLDADEVPLIDVKLEGGFGTNVYVPKLGDSAEGRAFTLVEQEAGHTERRVELAFSDEGVGENAARPALAARSAGRPFEQLFAVAFGPRAVAALPAERAGTEDVYGVSNEDGERMRRLLDAAAGNRHDLRITEGAGGLAFGITMGRVDCRLGHAVRSRHAGNEEHRGRCLHGRLRDRPRHFDQAPVTQHDGGAPRRVRSCAPRESRGDGARRPRRREGDLRDGGDRAPREDRRRRVLVHLRGARARWRHHAAGGDGRSGSPLAGGRPPGRERRLRRDGHRAHRGAERRGAPRRSLAYGALPTHPPGKSSKLRPGIGIGIGIGGVGLAGTF